MKNLKILTLSLIFISQINIAQVYIGAKAGMNISSASQMPAVTEIGIAENNISAFVPKIGGNGGLAILFKISNSIMLQSEFVYNTKGLKSKINNTFNDTAITGNWNYTLHYFQIPLMAKYVIGNGSAGPFVEIGAYYAYMLGGTFTKSVSYGTKILTDETTSIDNSFDNDRVKNNKNELGFKIGLGAQFPINGGNIMFFSLRYSQSFTDIYKFETTPENYSKTQNRVFQISVGYLFETTSDETKVYFY